MYGVPILSNLYQFTPTCLIKLYESHTGTLRFVNYRPETDVSGTKYWSVWQENYVPYGFRSFSIEAAKSMPLVELSNPPSPGAPEQRAISSEVRLVKSKESWKPGPLLFIRKGEWVWESYEISKDIFGNEYWSRRWWDKEGPKSETYVPHTELSTVPNPNIASQVIGLLS